MKLDRQRQMERTVTTAYIVSAARTAGGKRNGALSTVHPADLGALVLDAVVDRAQVDPALIEDVLLGCVTKAGEQAFAIGRNAVLASSRLPESVPGVTIDRQCGSSQQAIQFAAQAVMSGTQDLLIAGGVESMSRVPMGSDFSLHAKAGIGEGPWSKRILDKYGVEGFSQFTGAQMIVERYGFSRPDLDGYGLESHRRAVEAIRSGAFDQEIVPVPVGSAHHTQDEGVRFDASLEDMSKLNPIIDGGDITAANSSQICDGAAAVLVASEAAVAKHDLRPMARIHSFTITAGDPVIMLAEPIRATRTALERAGMTIDDIDLFEMNEAFASVPLAWMKELGVDHNKVNVNGGAIALGHPLGASGAKLMTTLIHALKARGLRYGLQTMCEGGGTANVMIVEAL